MPQHVLCDYVRKELSSLRWDRFLLPEAFTLGYHTPFYIELGEEERLALNHWTYSLMYTRISDGEEYVCSANPVLAQWIRPHSPVIADLIQREAAEEEDHVPAFRMIKAQINEHYGVDDTRYPKKYARGVLLSAKTIRALLKVFGVDYVVTYFVGRGVANHMGMGFERPVGAKADDDNGAICRASLLHTQDESQHMAVSHLMSAAAREFLPPARTGAIYRRMRRKLYGSAAYYTFAESMSKSLERAMCRQVVPTLGALAKRPAEFTLGLVDAHFESLSGIERSRNKTLGKQNRRLLQEAALEPDDRLLWEQTLVGNQANLRFLEPDTTPAPMRAGV